MRTTKDETKDQSPTTLRINQGRSEFCLRANRGKGRAKNISLSSSPVGKKLHKSPPRVSSGSYHYPKKELEVLVTSETQNRDTESIEFSGSDSDSSFCEYLDYHAYLNNPQIFRGQSFREDIEDVRTSANSDQQRSESLEVESKGDESEPEEYLNFLTEESDTDEEEEKEKQTKIQKELESLSGPALYQRHGLVFKNQGYAYYGKEGKQY